MRYVCYKTIVSKIIDENVTDTSTIRAILQIFKDKELTCGIRVGIDPVHTFCRILQVGEHDFRFLAIKGDGSLKKSARIADLEYLELKTDDEVIAATKPNVSRWLLLEPDGDTL